MLEIGTPGLTRRGLETGPWRTYTGTELETADTAKGSLPIPRQSSTLPIGRGLRRAPGTAPLLDPTVSQSPASSWTIMLHCIRTIAPPANCSVSSPHTYFPGEGTHAIEFGNTDTH